MIDEKADWADAVVVGSGFGGSAVAYRIADAQKSVCLIERGKRYPPGSFPRRPDEMARNFWDPGSGRHGLFDIWSFRHVESVMASGLGGGSLIYANVLIRKDERWFIRDGRAGALARFGYFFGDQLWQVYVQPVRRAAPQAWLRKAAW